MNSSLEEFVNSLDLNCKFKFSNGAFVANLDNSDQFSDAFSRVSMNKDLKVVDKQTVTEKNTSFTFTNGYFEVRMYANYDEDVYKIICEDR